MKGDETMNTTTSQTIQGNRESFLRQFDLQGKKPRESYLVTACNLQPSEFDHHELFRNPSGKTIIVCHNYDDQPPASLGMIQAPPIFSERTKTFVGVFPDQYAQAPPIFSERTKTFVGVFPDQYAFKRAMNQLKRERGF